MCTRTVSAYMAQIALQRVRGPTRPAPQTLMQAHCEPSDQIGWPRIVLASYKTEERYRRGRPNPFTHFLLSVRAAALHALDHRGSRPGRVRRCNELASRSILMVCANPTALRADSGPRPLAMWGAGAWSLGAAAAAYPVGAGRSRVGNGRQTQARVPGICVLWGGPSVQRRPWPLAASSSAVRRWDLPPFRKIQKWEIWNRRTLDSSYG